MNGSTHVISFSGTILARGFWLYVWEITAADHRKFYYVGRTGDSSSLNAQSPFSRLSQHLGMNPSSNALRRHLLNEGLNPETCTTYRLVSCGPLFPEENILKQHQVSRDVVAALEKALAEAMSRAGYSVLNTVRCRKPLDTKLFAKVQAEFAAHFPALRRVP